MANFIHWRKMTWALLLWGVVMTAWAVYSAGGTSPGCASDFGATSQFVTRQDCLAASSNGVGGSAVLWIVALGLAGGAVLGILWFMSRPLWRHGRGMRLRRLRGIQTGWVPRKLSD